MYPNLTQGLQSMGGAAEIRSGARLGHDKVLDAVHAMLRVHLQDMVGTLKTPWMHARCWLP